MLGDATKSTASSGNLTHFSGFADTYDHFRPAPPIAFVDLACQAARSERPALVVDLGCGTGLSTRIWAGRADTVIGIEPNADMRAEAERRSADNPEMRFRDGLSSATGLPDACADIVTVSQALHWMPPDETFREVARILRPGGVFAAIDNDWPPFSDWEAARAEFNMFHSHRDLSEKYRSEDQVRSWAKPGHQERIEKSGLFVFVRELMLHKVEPGSAERLYGLALSQGSIQIVLRRGHSADEIGLTAFRDALDRILGDRVIPLYWTYRIRLGIKPG